MREIILHYFVDEDRLTARLNDVGGTGKESRSNWSEDLVFVHVGKELVGFEVHGFRYFTDYAPLYQLFGGDFVSALSELQSEVVGEHRSEETSVSVRELSKAAERFSRSLLHA